MTPLHWAVERGHIPIIETLLRYGADVNLESKFGKSSLEIASDIARPDIFEILQNAEQFRAPININPHQSDAATLAATQSILPDDDLVTIEDPIPPVAEEKDISEINIKQEPGTLINLIPQLKI